MYTIGSLDSQMQQENRHLNYLTEKGWTMCELGIDEQTNRQEEIDALLIFEDTMSITCHWLIKLTQKVDVPIYLVTNGQDAHSNIVYLQLGVEACFSAKSEPEELYLTLNNLIARQMKDEEQRLNDTLNKQLLTVKTLGLEIIPRNLSVVIDGVKEIILTKKEYQALEILYMNPRKAISYSEFKKKLWQDIPDSEDQNYRIANIVFHLRSKIEQNTSKPRFIKTVRSKGYMLDIK